MSEERKKICPYCSYENDLNATYCEECGKRLKKKNRRWLLVLLLLILLLIYPILDSYEIPIKVQRDQLVREPFEITREVTINIPIEKQICQNRSFRYSTLGGNVDSFGAFVRPNLIIYNLENTWGYFKVNFSYIDEDKFPYDIYGGPNLGESLYSGKINFKDAEFYSPDYGFYLGPGESIAINNRTWNPDRSKSYWAIADIKEPKIEECFTKTEYINKTENKTFTEYKDIKKTVKVSEYRTITKILKIENFAEWFIIIFMLFLIIILIFKIKREIKD